LTGLKLGLFLGGIADTFIKVSGYVHTPIVEGGNKPQLKN